MAIGVHVHQQIVVRWASVDEIVGILGIRVTEPGGDNGHEKTTIPQALAFTDPATYETHVYVIAEELRLQLVKILSGGITIASPDELHKLREERGT